MDRDNWVVIIWFGWVVTCGYPWLFDSLLIFALCWVKYFFATFFEVYDTTFMHERAEDLCIFEGIDLGGNENNAYCVWDGQMTDDGMDHGWENKTCLLVLSSWVGCTVVSGLGVDDAMIV